MAADGPTRPQYEAFACGRNCHPDRYTVFATRTMWGRKRWGIRDNHMGINLTRLCTSSEAAELWRIHLATMELRERQHTDRADAWRAERAVDDGLDRLFRRLGQPADRNDEK